MRTALACAGIAGVLATHASAAQAQTQLSAGVALTNDYRVRGISYSNLHPAVSLSLAGDFAGGFYAGATGIAQDVTDDVRALGDVEYLGYARRLRNEVTWEVGLDHQRYDSYGPLRLHLNYADIYAGVAKGVFSARLYYSPNYNGDGHSVAYLEGNATLRPADQWRVAGHVGIQEALNGWRGSTKKPRYDGRVEVIRSFGRAEVSLGVVGATPDLSFAQKRSRPGVVVGAAVYF